MALLELGNDVDLDRKHSTAKWAYKTASQQSLELNDIYLNQKVCWYGGLRGYPELVKSNCDLAVSLAEKNDPENLPNYLRGRGIVRARTGNKQGAIEDLQTYVDWCQKNKCTQDTIKQFQELITSLQSAKKSDDEIKYIEIFSRSLYFD